MDIHKTENNRPVPMCGDRILSELKELFEFVPPGRLRRSLLDLYFHCQTTSETPGLPNEETLTPHFYYLINFLEEVDEVVRERELPAFPDHPTDHKKIFK